MFKKFLKIFLIIIIIIILILIINFIRNNIIINKLHNLRQETLNNNQNYHIVESVVMSTEYLQRDEYLRKDDKYYYEHYCYNNLESQSNNEFLLPSLITSPISTSRLFTIIKERSNDYIVYDEYIFIYDKNTGLLKKFIIPDKLNFITITSYTYEFDTVTDEDVEKPIMNISKNIK